MTTYEVDEVDATGNTTSHQRKQLRAKRWVFTLNNYNEVDEVDILDFVNKRSAEYVIGKEIGDNGTPHLQGFLLFPDRIDFNLLKKLNSRIHWEVMKGSVKQNITYCTKSDNYITNLKSLNDPHTLYIKNMCKEMEEKGFHPWQQNIIDICNTEPDDRKINWIYDLDGNKGKSYLCKYLFAKYKCIISDGKKDNIFNQVLTFFEKENPANTTIILLDIPRHNLQYVNYGVLESLKNGLIYSGKYEGGCVAFKAPHVFVFANELPDLSKFSQDRWNIIEL